VTRTSGSSGSGPPIFPSGRYAAWRRSCLTHRWLLAPLSARSIPQSVASRPSRAPSGCPPAPSHWAACPSSEETRSGRCCGRAIRPPTSLRSARRARSAPRESADPPPNRG
jgi:hypothetical protein